MSPSLAAAAVALVLLVPLQQGDKPEVLRRCDVSKEPVAHWVMPESLQEISGLARNDAGRLLTHGDERGEVFTLDERTGKVLARWALQGTPHDDFEGIAVAGKTVYLMTSSGHIYTTREGADGEEVPWTKAKTGLGKLCELEGLAWDPKDRVLLLPCKVPRTVDTSGDVVVFRWSVDQKTLAEPAYLRFPLKALTAAIGATEFHGTSVELDPRSGHFLVLSSHHRAVVELSHDGKFLGAVALTHVSHKQPEGLTIGPDRLYISDEGRKRDGTVTVYACR
jgi:uncharacterized protein YjiK